MRSGLEGIGAQGGNLKALGGKIFIYAQTKIFFKNE
jgi:hypothetical protein